MTKQEAQEFKARWKLVNEFTADEMRGMDPEYKLQQMSAMFSAGELLGWTSEDGSEVRLVRERWRILREKLGD